MLKLSKKADYGLIALRHLAVHYDGGSFSASDIAEAYGISSTLMAKILQKLSREGLVVARHGSTGGYQLNRHPSNITILEAIRAVEGPLFITSCVTVRGECDQTDRCTIREPLRRVNQSLEDVLRRITISHMKEEVPAEEKRESKKPVDLVSIT